jgi:hypothetical protein
MPARTPSERLYFLSTVAHLFGVSVQVQLVVTGVAYLWAEFLQPLVPPVTGFQGDGGSAVSATLNLNSTSGLALDSKGNLYIGDTGNNRVRQVTTNGLIATIAGDGTFGVAGGSSPQLGGPSGLAIDAAGNLLIAESGANRVRKFSNGALSAVAGTGSSFRIRVRL